MGARHVCTRTLDTSEARGLVRGSTVQVIVSPGDTEENRLLLELVPWMRIRGAPSGAAAIQRRASRRVGSSG